MDKNQVDDTPVSDREMRALSSAERWRENSERKSLVINRISGILDGVRGAAFGSASDAEKVEQIKNILNGRDAAHE